MDKEDGKKHPGGEGPSGGTKAGYIIPGGGGGIPPWQGCSRRIARGRPGGGPEVGSGGQPGGSPGGKKVVVKALGVLAFQVASGMEEPLEVASGRPGGGPGGCKGSGLRGGGLTMGDAYI